MKILDKGHFFTGKLFNNVTLRALYTCMYSGCDLYMYINKCYLLYIIRVNTQYNRLINSELNVKTRVLTRCYALNK